MGAFTNYPSLPAIDTADQGVVWLPTINMPSSQSGAAVVASANQVRFLQVHVPKIIISKITVEVAAKSASANQMADFGLYSADGGTLIFQTSAGVATGSGITNGAFTVTIKNAGGTGVITIPEGNYLYAWTSQDAAVTFRATTMNSAVIMIPGTIKVFGVAGNAATNGILPATLGTLTTSASNQAQPLAILQR